WGKYAILGSLCYIFFFQAEDGIRDFHVTGVQTCALPICMLPRDLLDDVKQLASTQTGIRPDRIMISATHTHTAASACGALGTDRSEERRVGKEGRARWSGEH